jgi:hypothetical protein
MNLSTAWASVPGRPEMAYTVEIASRAYTTSLNRADCADHAHRTWPIHFTFSATHFTRSVN